MPKNSSNLLIIIISYLIIVFMMKSFGTQYNGTTNVSKISIRKLSTSSNELLSQ